MKKKPERRMAEALTDLTIFHAIIGILENGCVYTQSGKERADKIIKLCKLEGSQQLYAYDEAKEELEK